MTTVVEKYRGYTIKYASDGPFVLAYVHDSFDGPGDNRYGYGDTVEECREEIDEQLEEDE